MEREAETAEDEDEKTRKQPRTTILCLHSSSSSSSSSGVSASGFLVPDSRFPLPRPHPLMTPMGFILATFRASPASWTQATTSSTSL